MSKSPPHFVSRVYARATTVRPRAYSDYENFAVTWGRQENYEVLRRIGRGKYSEVFLGKNRTNDELCVAKILKPVRKLKIKREIKVLQNLCGGPNIARLLDVVRDNHTQIPTLIFDWIENEHFRDLYPTLSDFDVRYYIFQLLRALDFCHSRGIMHRDVKPHNIMIDHRRRELRLIDWGLADFYRPGTQYNVRVASRYFKAPELLVNFREYNYSIDMWGVGCILAGIIFDRDPMFKGRNNMYQLIQIAKVLGTKRLNAYLDKYDVDLDIAFDGILGDFVARPWSSFVVPKRSHYASEAALEVVDRLLRYDHRQRLSAAEAMEHEYFALVRERRTGDARTPEESATKEEKPSHVEASGGAQARVARDEGTGDDDDEQNGILGLMMRLRSTLSSALFEGSST